MIHERDADNDRGESHGLNGSSSQAAIVCSVSLSVTSFISHTVLMSGCMCVFGRTAAVVQEGG